MNDRGPVNDKVQVDVTVPVEAEFQWMPGSPVTTRAVRLSVSRIDPERGPIVQMYGGPTGYESFYAEDFLDSAAPYGEDLTWVACGGYDNRWARCTVSDKEMRVAFINLGFEL